MSKSIKRLIQNCSHAIQERLAANKLFADEEVVAQVESQKGQFKTFEPGMAKKMPTPALQGHSPDQLQKIKEALSKAKTLDEITRLERQLQTGQIPSR